MALGQGVETERSQWGVDQDLTLLGGRRPPTSDT